jgi:hypothetical protein
MWDIARVPKSNHQGFRKARVVEQNVPPNDFTGVPQPGHVAP